MLAKYIAAGLAGSAHVCDRCVRTNADHHCRSRRQAPAATSDSSAFQGDWRTSKVVGLNVYNDSNESIGSINDLLTDKSGNIKAAVISVGGFLGVGSHLVAVPFDKIKFVNEPVAYTGAASTSPAGSKPATTTTTGAPAPPGTGEGQSLVSRPRRVQRHQGSVEGDARVQVLELRPHRVRLTRESAPGNRARFFVSILSSSCPAPCRASTLFCMAN